MDARVKPAHDEQNSSRIKHDDAAHGLAGLHRGKALVDLGQFQLRRDPVLEMQLAALIGCGVITGYGAVVNTAKVAPGESVVVIGCGGVGMAAINGA